MSRKTTYFLIIAIVAVALALRYLPSVLLPDVSEQAIYSHTYHSYERYCTRSRIAIITPRARWNERGLQTAVTRGLRNNLSSRTTACDVHGDDEGNYSTVHVFESEDEAIPWQPGCVIHVTPKKWRYLPTPFASTWKAEVGVDVLFAEADCDTYHLVPVFRVDAEMSGRVLGFRRSSFPLSRISYRAGRDLALDVRKHLDRSCRAQLEDEPDDFPEDNG